MKKAFLVEFNLMTRVVIDESDENLETIVQAALPNIQYKIENGELGENLSEWYPDEEMPYDPLYDDWGALESYKAMEEGWGIFECLGHTSPYQIQRHDEAAIFKSDAEVWKFLKSSPLPLHQKALSFIKTHSPEEYGKILSI